MRRPLIRRRWCAASAMLVLLFVSPACASSDTAPPTDEAIATPEPTQQPTAPPEPTPTVTPSPNPSAPTSPTAAPDTDEPTTPTVAPLPTEPASPTTHPTPTPAESPTAAPPAPPDRPDAPWAGRPLADSAVPAFLIDDWNASERSGPALFPARIAVAHPAAVARRAEFGGGWGVAWDRRSGPGRNADGSYCDDCGRSAFGVAAIPSDTVLDDLRDDAIVGSSGPTAAAPAGGTRDSPILPTGRRCSCIWRSPSTPRSIRCGRSSARRTCLPWSTGCDSSTASARPVDRCRPA